MTVDMFEPEGALEARQEPLAPGAMLLRRFACEGDAVLLADVRRVIAQAPLRHMVTPGGLRMSVAMTNCGAWGWVTDRSGYRYEAMDLESGRRWPPLPDSLLRLARDAAAACGFAGFVPDACLINRYQPGARLSLHQDKDERDFGEPIVSVSLGVPAVFLFGGIKRSDRTKRVAVRHGDVVVWGGPARLNYHGVLPLPAGRDPLLGDSRINLTLRKAT